MNKYVIIYIEELGEFDNYQSSILVKVNPVKMVNFGFGDRGQYVAHEYEETLWLIFKNSPYTNNLTQFKNYAKAGESGVFLDWDIDNWFDKRDIIVNEKGNLHNQIIYVARAHDEYFDEMEYYYQTHGNEAYSKWEEEQYIAHQRRRRDAGLMYDDSIESSDEYNEWDY